MSADLSAEASAKAEARRDEDGSLGEGGAIVKKPVAVYIEKVYEEGDFASLGIGT